MSGRAGLILCCLKYALKRDKIKALNSDEKSMEEKRGLLPVEREVRLPISPMKSSAGVTK